jgi:hypothetical protein
VKKSIVLLMALLLAACNLPRAVPAAAPPPATDTPVYQNCYFNWATQPLPDLSRQVQAAVEKADLRGVTARAEAYGENCLDAATNKIVGFSAMETDYRITAEVTDLKDTEALGSLLERILVVLDQFPTRSTPGPQPGYVGVRFTAREEELNLWFLMEAAKAAREEGLHGSQLLERLLKK